MTRSKILLHRTDQRGVYVDAKLSVENILSSPHRFAHGEDFEEENVAREYDTGTTFTLTLGVKN